MFFLLIYFYHDFFIVILFSKTLLAAPKRFWEEKSLESKTQWHFSKDLRIFGLFPKFLFPGFFSRNFFPGTFLHRFVFLYIYLSRVGGKDSIFLIIIYEMFFITEFIIYNIYAIYTRMYWKLAKRVDRMYERLKVSIMMIRTG